MAGANPAIFHNTPEKNADHLAPDTWPRRMVYYKYLKLTPLEDFMSFTNYLDKTLTEATKPIAKNVIIQTVGASCPKCGGDITQDGSMQIDLTRSDPLKCNDCGLEVELPKKYK